MNVGELRKALENIPDDVPVLIVGHEANDDTLITFNQRIVAVEDGFADTHLDIEWDLTFSTKEFYLSERAVRILGSDDEPSNGETVIFNSVAPPVKYDFKKVIESEAAKFRELRATYHTPEELTEYAKIVIPSGRVVMPTVKVPEDLNFTIEDFAIISKKDSDA